MFRVGTSFIFSSIKSRSASVTLNLICTVLSVRPLLRSFPLPFRGFGTLPNKQFSTDVPQRGRGKYGSGYPLPMLAMNILSLMPLCLTTELCPVLPNLRKEKTLQSSKKITTLSIPCSLVTDTSYLPSVSTSAISFAVALHNPYALIAHTVKERVKSPPLRVLFPAAFPKGTGLRIYCKRSISSKKICKLGCCPLVLNVRKVARRDKHFVAHFLAALLAPCPRRLYRCPKSLEVVFWYWSFLP